MRSNYKRLGDYIRLVNVRNHDDSVKELLGINIDKFFMPSVANIVGTDLSKYKVVTKNQFACNRMHVGRDYRIPIAKSDSETPFIVSPAYDVFEIINEDILTPDYLMLWFKRKEFDRNAWFYTDADVRGGLNWNALINMKFPLPSLEKQKEIVAEYQTVEQRIRLNKKLCQKLEETAQTIYKQWFEAFEFPVIARAEAQQNDEAISTNHILQVAEHTAEYQNRSELVAERNRWVAERSRSYKSSGGEMVYSEELGREIPKGWEILKISDIIDVRDGTHDSPSPTKKGIHLITSTHLDSFSIRFNDAYLISEEDFQKIEKRSGVSEKDILVSMIGTVGNVNLIFKKNLNFAIKNIGLFRTSKAPNLANYLFFFLKGKYCRDYFDSELAGSTQNYISLSTLRNIPIIFNEKIAFKYNDTISKIVEKIHIINQNTQKLEALKSLLLGKMAVEEY